MLTLALENITEFINITYGGCYLIILIASLLFKNKKAFIKENITLLSICLLISKIIETAITIREFSIFYNIPISHQTYSDILVGNTWYYFWSGIIINNLMPITILLTPLRKNNYVPILITVCIYFDLSDSLWQFLFSNLIEQSFVCRQYPKNYIYLLAAFSSLLFLAISIIRLGKRELIKRRLTQRRSNAGLSLRVEQFNDLKSENKCFAFSLSLSGTASALGTLAVMPVTQAIQVASP